MYRGTIKLSVAYGVEAGTSVYTEGECTIRRCIWLFCQKVDETVDVHSEAPSLYMFRVGHAIRSGSQL